MVSFSKTPPSSSGGGSRQATDAERADLATVVEVIDSKSVVINRGRREGITFGSRFVIFEQTSRELRDPTTGESLGALEVPRGTGVVTHLQERVCVVTSDERAQSNVPFGPAMDTRLPYNGAAVGDRARLLWLNG